MSKNKPISDVYAYHAEPQPGKQNIKANKVINNAKYMSLAYFQGVAELCLKISNDP